MSRENKDFSKIPKVEGSPEKRKTLEENKKASDYFESIVEKIDVSIVEKIDVYAEAQENRIKKLEFRSQTYFSFLIGLSSSVLTVAIIFTLSSFTELFILKYDEIEELGVNPLYIYFFIIFIFIVITLLLFPNLVVNFIKNVKVIKSTWQG